MCILLRSVNVKDVWFGSYDEEYFRSRQENMVCYDGCHGHWSQQLACRLNHDYKTIVFADHVILFNNFKNKC